METKELPPIRPLMGDKAPRWTDETQTECGCDFCQHWHPIIQHIRAKLDGEELKLFDEFAEDWDNKWEDLCYAEARLYGTWPGWEAIKNFKPKAY